MHPNVSLAKQTLAAPSHPKDRITQSTLCERMKISKSKWVLFQNACQIHFYLQNIQWNSFSFQYWQGCWGNVPEKPETSNYIWSQQTFGQRIFLKSQVMRLTVLYCLKPDANSDLESYWNPEEWSRLVFYWRSPVVIIVVQIQKTLKCST